MKFLQDTAVSETCTSVYIEFIDSVYKRYTSEFYNILKFRAVFFEGSLLGCYRARRGGVGDDGGIQPEHSRALTDSWEERTAGRAAFNLSIYAP